MVTALDVAQRYISAVEGGDLDAVAATLSDDVVQFFMHSRRTTTAEGVAPDRGWRPRPGVQHCGAPRQD